jgi:ribosomal protein S18 acetylase RimI-like enzyme
MVTIIDYHPRHRDDFKRLNLAWIEQYFTVEESDATLLNDPDKEIIANGGHIFVAEESENVLGVCSLLPAGAGVFQLAKMAVDPEAQGRGIGRKLGNAAIGRAREKGAGSVVLFSNTVMVPAINLYRSLGFIEVPLEGADHERSNIKMVLALR